VKLKDALTAHGASVHPDVLRCLVTARNSPPADGALESARKFAEDS
jgi:hypothetical protein